MAEAKFFQEAATVQHQTVTTLIRVYKQVFRDQYISTTTAGQHGLTANQAVVAPDNGTCASTRNADEGFNAVQMAQIQAMITKAVNPEVTAEGGRGKRRNRQGRDQQEGAPYVKPQPFAIGVCPVHPHMATPHTWEQCSRNPARKNK